MKLDEYKKKRDPATTNEPFGPEPAGRAQATLSGAFVVHLHDATRRHYDLRVEVGGVLMSFAVPRGPSLDPDAKQLAVQTEPHPLEYLDFEAVIPKGNYGAGPMILWDRGQIRYLEAPAEQGLADGKLDFVLQGYKLRGRFALVRLKGSKNEWLLFKKKDAHSSKEIDIQASQPRSILSGLTVEELEQAPAIARDIEAEAARLGAPTRRVEGPKVSPMLCASDGAPTSAEGWLYELKLDGVRIIAGKEGDEVTLTYRSARDTTAAYPEVARAVRALATPRAVLDGEIVAFDDKGHPNFQRLGQRIHLTRPADVQRAMLAVPVVFMLFDLVAIGDRDLSPLPLVQRKRLLRRLVPAAGVMRVLDHLEGDGEALLAFCRQRHLEGVVAKRAGSPYRQGPKRTGDWVKMKCERDEDFVVVGYKRGERGRGELGALDIATYEGDDLVVRGKVGSGFDQKELDRMLAKLEALKIDKPSLKGKLGAAPRGRTFVRPEVVVSVRFLGWSDDGSVRFPVYRGELADRDPKSCTAAPHAAALDAEPAKREEAPAEEPPPSLAAPAPGHRATLSNRSKLLWPEDGYAKIDLWTYYEAIAPALLPILRERPLILVRYPDGIHGKNFFQWNVPSHMPSWMESLTIPPGDDDPADKREKRIFIVNDVDGLLWVANLACIPMHILACRRSSLDQCDFFTVDFDLKGAPLANAVRLALTLRELLDEIGLSGFPKTSGQTGLHVLVPLGPGVGFATGRGLADLLARVLVHRHPDLATMERVVAKRAGRIYLDTGQTGPTRTIVAPYSVRAVPRATVSTPLTWDEVAPGLDPSAFTIKTVPARVAERGDPMAALLKVRPSVEAAVARLEDLLKRTRVR